MATPPFASMESRTEKTIIPKMEKHSVPKHVDCWVRTPRALGFFFSIQMTKELQELSLTKLIFHPHHQRRRVFN